MKIECIDALEKIKKLKDNSQDIIFADPPYALGSTVLIDKDGKPYYKEARDFMNKWNTQTRSFGKSSLLSVTVFLNTEEESYFLE